MTFAERIEQAAQEAHKAAHPDMASKAEICANLQSAINELWAMPRPDALAFIRATYSHIGHQALAVRMFKNQPV